MLTRWKSSRSADPRQTAIEEIVATCVGCGLCNAVCPTYLLTGDEREGPRGRLHMISQLFGPDAKRLQAAVAPHLDRCLTCHSCTAHCPADVDFTRAMNLARAELAESACRPAAERRLRSLLMRILPFPRRFRTTALLTTLARPLAPLFDRIGAKRFAIAIRQSPGMKSALRPSHRKKTTGENRRGRVILTQGCTQNIVRRDIDAATVRLLNRMGFEILFDNREECCGAIAQNLGFARDADGEAARNVQRWWELIKTGPLDAIVTTNATCGNHIKGYSRQLHGNAELERKSIHISGLTRDVSEFLAGFDLGPPKRWSSLRVAYHAPCTLLYGQRAANQPSALLRKAGFAVAEIAEPHLCCGSAGTYKLLQPEHARSLRDRKIDNIEVVQPDIVATSSVGCLTHLQSGTGIPVVHTIELLDWAYGGPCPRGLEIYRDRVSDVPGSAIPDAAE